jgi:rhodanese-related sulfurtransferase
MRLTAGRYHGYDTARSDGGVRSYSTGVPTEIGIEELQRLLREEDAQLVEVLPEREYEEEHLPGAISLPLKRLTASGAQALDRSRPVIVYCWDDG